MAKCCIEHCEREAGVKGSARGLCRAHYKRWCRYGDAAVEVKRVPSWNGEPCTEVGCDSPIYAHGLCTKHYALLRRRSNPEAQRIRNNQFKKRQEEKLVQLAGRPRATFCELCDEESKTVWDHDHATGKFRGWLCDRCNRTLGQVKDSPALLFKMIEYLEEHSGKVDDKETECPEGF